ncbi:MAG: peptide/nickel transport system permease protein [Solirubrobacteraceae bacterium]
MWRLVARRLLAVPLVLLGITFVVFVAVDLSPNDPSTAALGPYASKQAKEQFAAEHGLDDPMPVRYVRFLADAAHGDLGTSVVRGEDVSATLRDAAPVTLQLTAMALVLAVLASTLLGTLGALLRDRWPDRFVRVYSAAGVAAPDFWIGILVVQFVCVKWSLLPAGGYVPFAEDPVQWFQHLIMPATVLAIPVSATLAVVVRASVAKELGRDYVRTARGSGLPRWNVIGKHVFRNAMVGPLTLVGVVAGNLLGGAVIVESIFTLPGLGTVLITGVREGDLAPIRGVVILGATAFVLTSLIVDLLYLALNPKLRHAR